MWKHFNLTLNIQQRRFLENGTAVILSNYCTENQTDQIFDCFDKVLNESKVAFPRQRTEETFNEFCRVKKENCENEWVNILVIYTII